MKKRISKHLPLLLSILMIALVMSGCVRHDAAGNPSGFIYQYIGKPVGHLLELIAKTFGGNHGIAVIIVTMITRIIMMPSQLKMTRQTMESQFKMSYAQPEIDAIQAEIKATQDTNRQAQLQQELMAVYKDYDINMMSGLSGCLPLLIQLPIISAVYAAIRSSQEIQESTFLGIQLGERSMVMVVLVVVLAFAQGWLMQQSTPQNQSANNDVANQTSKSMMIMNPVMLGWITYTYSAGLGLYFLTTTLFGVGQQLYTNYVVRPKIQAELEEEAEKYQKIRQNKRQSQRRNVTPTSNSDKNTKKNLVPTKNTPGKKRRNEGLQNKRK